MECNMKNIVIYTAITGGYDDLKSVFQENGFDYICFTDYNFNGSVPSPWLHIRLPLSKLSNKNLARYCKLNPHKLLPQYDSSIWIDGNINIKSSIYDFTTSILSEHDVATYDHWWRDKTEQEFYECARVGFDSAWKLRAQCKRYYDNGYSSTNFYENNVIFRNHMKNKVIKMHEIWWNEYLRGGKRDQYSFTYASFKANQEIFSLGVHDPRVTKKYFDYNHHVSKRPLKQYFMMIVNLIYMKLSFWKVSVPSRANLLLYRGNKK